MIRIGLLLLLSLSALQSAWAESNFPAPVEGDRRRQEFPLQVERSAARAAAALPDRRQART